MDLWESIGLWKYPIPGVYILEQFCLGAFIAMGNLANRSILQYLAEEDAQSNYDHDSVEGEKMILFPIGILKNNYSHFFVLLFLLDPFPLTYPDNGKAQYV